MLKPIENIRCQDAILDLSDPEHPKEPEWPEAEFIVGNPPFLGGKLLRNNLGDDYVDAMFHVWGERVPREADLCCYWFEKARRQIELEDAPALGLLATQGIRGGANRKVLERIKQTGDIFFAESDRDWVLDGANVHVSMIGFDRGSDDIRVLDGNTVAQINANLRSTADTTLARSLDENLNVSYMGDTKGGAFDISESAAIKMLVAPNPNGYPNSDVLVPWINGMDMTRRPRNMWIIDFGVNLPMELASRYELPFEYVVRNVQPERATNNRGTYRDRWWIHVEPRPALRTSCIRYCVSPLPCVSRSTDSFFGLKLQHCRTVQRSRLPVPMSVFLAFSIRESTRYGPYGKERNWRRGRVTRRRVVSRRFRCRSACGGRKAAAVRVATLRAVQPPARRLAAGRGPTCRRLLNGRRS